MREKGGRMNEIVEEEAEEEEEEEEEEEGHCRPEPASCVGVRRTQEIGNYSIVE